MSSRGTPKRTRRRGAASRAKNKRGAASRAKHKRGASSRAKNKQRATSRAKHTRGSASSRAKQARRTRSRAKHKRVAASRAHPASSAYHGERHAAPAVYAYRRLRAYEDTVLPHKGGVVRIPKGSSYYADSDGAPVIGWHGTFDPPLGMDGRSMVEGAAQN